MIVEHLHSRTAARLVISMRYSSISVPGTACWPCRQRKVKCDNKSPCENCVKREHPQLCSYKPNRSATGKSVSLASSEQPTPGSGAKKRAHSPEEHEPRRSQSDEAREAISAYGE